MSLVEQKLGTSLKSSWAQPRCLVRLCCSNFCYLCSVFSCFIDSCLTFCSFNLDIVLSVILWFMASYSTFCSFNLDILLSVILWFMASYSTFVLLILTLYCLSFCNLRRLITPFVLFNWTLYCLLLWCTASYNTFDIFKHFLIVWMNKWNHFLIIRILYIL
jgi:hypothetical protein